VQNFSLQSIKEKAQNHWDENNMGQKNSQEAHIKVAVHEDGYLTHLRPRSGGQVN